MRLSPSHGSRRSRTASWRCRRLWIRRSRSSLSFRDGGERAREVGAAPFPRGRGLKRRPWRPCLLSSAHTRGSQLLDWGQPPPRRLVLPTAEALKLVLEGGDGKPSEGPGERQRSWPSRTQCRGEGGGAPRCLPLLCGLCRRTLLQEVKGGRRRVGGTSRRRASAGHVVAGGASWPPHSAGRPIRCW